MKNNWPVKKLGEVASLEYGKGLPEKNRVSGKVPVFGSNGLVGYHNQSLVAGPGIIVGRKGSIGEVVWSEKDFWPIDTTYFIKLKDKQNLKFIYYLFRTLNLQSLNKASGVPGLNRNDVYELALTIPPIDFQKKIVERLDAIRKAQKLCDTQISKTEELFNTLLNTELKEKENWGNKEFGEIAFLKRGPFGGSLKKEIFVKSGYKVYEQKNAINNDFSIGTYFITEEKFKEMEDFGVKSGDLIVSCSGTIGKVAVVPDNVQEGIINQALLKITPISNEISSEYLIFLIQTGYMQRKMFGSARGSSIKNVASVKEIKKVKVKLPTKKEQQKIVEKLSAVQDYKKLLLKQKFLLKELFDSVLDKSMKGEF